MSRQRVYRTPAVVLKRMDLGEADRIITFFSRDEGKVRAVAKGVRRGTSRSAGHLEPFTLTDVLFAVGRELDVVSQALTLEAFRVLREDLERATHAYYVAEVVDLLTADRQEHRAVFDILVDSLHALSQAVDPRLVLIAFHLRLLDELGYRPELRQCVECHAPIEPVRNHFSPLQGGALCPACGPRDASARSISVPALKLLRFVQQSQQAINVPHNVVREAEAVLRDYAEHIVERRLRTPALMARVSEAETYNPAAT